MAIQIAPNLIQGVTQQAPQQARDSQCEEQFDCFNSATRGCDARPPFEFVNRVLTSVDLRDAHFAPIRRNDEYYLACFTSGSPMVINLLTGQLANVTMSNPATYLQQGSLKGAQKFRSQVVEDTTFVINRQVRCAMSAARSPQRANQALVFVSGGQYASWFWVSLSGPASEGVGILTHDDYFAEASPAYIVRKLVEQINANTATTGYRAHRNGDSSSFLIDREDGQDFNINTTDTNGDSLMLAFKQEAPSFNKLPARGWPGMVLKVRGEDRAKADDFYVKYVGDYSTGVWEETVAPNIPININADTMPHLLVNTGFNTFEYKRASWSSRIAGDEETAKDPSFIGKYLKDVFWYGGRMGLLTENSVVFSKTRYPYTFFPDTAQAVLATAPIDTSLIPASDSSQGASDLDLVCQMDDILMAWAQSAQFRIHSHNEPLKQDTIDTGLSSAYEYSEITGTLSLKQSIYFASEGDGLTTMRELQFNQGRLVGDTEPSSHVPTYLPEGIKQFAASDTFRTIFMHTGTNQIWVYNFLDGNNERIQSAFSTWRLPKGGEVLWLGVLGSYLRVLYRMNGELSILRFDLATSKVDPIEGAGYRTRLDFLVTQAELTSVTFNPTTNLSTFTLPYTPAGNTKLRVILAEDSTKASYTRGREFMVDKIVGRVVTVRGDVTGEKLYVGHQIISSRKELRFFVRTDRGVVPLDRLTIDNVQLEFSNTGYTRMEATYSNNPQRPSIATFESRTLGTPSATTETVKPSNGKLMLSVQGAASDVDVTLINDSYLPSRWVSLSWEYTAVGRQGEGGRR